MTLPDMVRDWPADWRDLYEERAAILQHCAGHPRGRAERLAEQQVRAAHARAHGGEQRGLPLGPAPEPASGHVTPQPSPPREPAETIAGLRARAVLG